SAEALNGDALTDLVANHGVKHSPLPSDVVAALKVKTAEVLAAGAAADPTTKKVHESLMSFKKKHDSWKGLSEAGFMKAVNG
ncbi:MAG: ABC transporter substrate-binding protein, partial [Hyphomicrobiaceae bacterium]|nr:ABC transporter substrate-binding protein [Hyphomicrobiaceae bacterium]